MVNKTTPAERFLSYLEHIGGFEPNPVVAVAVSGGIDSMALLWLAQQWAQAKKGKVKAVTVDHHLREESTDEALWVHDYCKTHHIDHHILTWHHSAILTGNLMARAREARYQLLQDYCYQQSILHLLTAHQANDQLETFILHLERGSGLKGLSGMTPITYFPYVRLLRPLLGEQRSTLKTLLQTVGWSWREDPSNDNQRYDRIKIRKTLDSLTKESCLTAPRWLTSINALEQTQHDFDLNISKKIPYLLTIHPEGYITIDRGKMKDSSLTVAIQILAKCLTLIGVNFYAPRWHQLEKLQNLIQSKVKSKRTTLGGCLIILKQSQIIICRELAAVSKEPIYLEEKSHFLWDNRFMIKTEKILKQHAKIYVAALGTHGWRHVITIDETLKKLPYPREVVLTLPAIWQQKEERLDILAAVPHLSFKTAKIKKGSLLDKVTVHYKPHVCLHTVKKQVNAASKQTKKDHHCG